MTDENDDLSAAKGLALSLILSVGFWALLFLLWKEGVLSWGG